MEERVVSHYRLVEALGSGSMGRVYKAWDMRLNRWVALKFLPPQMADDSKASARFRREAQAASSLEHGHICSIFDIDRDEDGENFLVMAWYEGETIAKKIESGPVPVDLALKYARQIGLGLAAAHRQGIVHRDIKPANVIITWDNEAVILDFGVAYLMDQTRLSRPGSRSGTLAYMAPEQFRGGDPQPSMDIWSVGILLYEMLAGHLPFTGEHTPALTYAIAHDDPLPLPKDIVATLPESDQVMGRCLAKNPEDRYDSAADLAADLSLLSQDSQSGGTTSQLASRAAGRWRRRVALGVAALVLVGVGIVAGMKGLINSPGPDRPGVAVLPFVVNKEGMLLREFGEGLSWLLANRLSHLASASDEFWVVPPEDVFLYDIRDPEAARNNLGVERVISGVGSISGSTLSLHLDFRDATGGAPATREFRDDLANLPTWQRGLAEWSLEQLDSELPVDATRILARGCTQVPEALYDFLDGIAWSRRYPDRDPDLKKYYRQRALNSFSSAVRRDSSFACARSEYGNVLRLQNGGEESVRQSETHLLVATRLDPLDAEPLYYLGNLSLAKGDTQMAMAAFDDALGNEPDLKPALMAKIGVFIHRKDEDSLDRTVRILKEARPGYALDCLALGLSFWNASDMPRAAANFRDAVALIPHSPRALYYLGASLFNLDRDPEAETLFLKAIAIEPDDQVYQNLGTYYYYNNRYSDALVQYRKSLEMQPEGRYDVWAYVAECYRYSSGFQDSVTFAFERARNMAEARLVASPEDSWLMAQLATFYSVLGDTTRTLDLLTQLADEQHLGADSEFLVSVAWEDIGRRSKALMWLERAFSDGLEVTRVEGYPGFRNLRTDPDYAELANQHR